jgi:putative ABC transport system permease protein
MAPPPLGAVLKNEYPEVQETVAIEEMTDQYIVEYKGVKFMQDGFRETSPTIFDVLDYKVIIGNLSTALKEPNSVVLTKSLAEKIMGNKIDINCEIKINNKLNKVTAIIEDLPKNMDLQFKALIPGYKERDPGWLGFDGYLYVKFHSNVPHNFQKILSTIEEKQYVPRQKELEGVKIKLIPQKLTELHFSNELLADSPKGNILYVWFFAIVAFVILIVACINFINLAMARISERNYIAGICKINGAGKNHSAYFQLFEALIITSLSIIISIALLFKFIPYLNLITNKDIAPNIFSYNFLAIISFVFITVIVVISGFPLLFSVLFSNKHSFQNSLKKDYTSSLNYRGGLVVVQFTFTIALMVCLFAFQRQMKYMKNKDLGFNIDNVLVINTPFDKSYAGKINLFYDRLKNLPMIDQISLAYGGAFPGNFNGGEKAINASEIDGEMKQFIVSYCDIDEKYFKLLDIKLLKGEAFSGNSKTNADKCLINEAYAKIIGRKDDPIGKEIPRKVIGVVKDFNFLSPHNPIEPMCFRYSNGYPGHIFIKKKGNILPDLKLLWKKTIPDYPFLYSDLTSSYNSQYIKDDNTYTIISFFTILNILISCMGMIGLIKYTVDKRTKEIGIRKVNGAKISEVMAMLSKDFIIWLAIAFIIASPLAWFVMNKWLQQFAYKTELGWWVFALAGLLALGIALLTVSWQSWRAATRNPVESLRYE